MGMNEPLGKEYGKNVKLLKKKIAKIKKGNRFNTNFLKVA